MKYILIIVFLLAGCISSISGRPMTDAEFEIWYEFKECLVNKGEITQEFSDRLIPPNVARDSSSYHIPGVIVIQSDQTIENQAFVWKHEMTHEVDSQLGNSGCFHSGKNERCSSLWEWSDIFNSFAISVCQ